MLPGVIQSLGKIGKLEDFVAFTKLVSEEKFPLDNIAFLLFLDVVRWFGLEQTTSLFRYSDECKLFWNTGYKIFKGRFLRFMGGPKHRGQSQDGNEVLGRFLPENAKINFAVPNKRLLKDECKIVSVEVPGIMTKMIETVAESDRDQVLTYKICVDGKKINASSKGEVNLWGYENSPTFEMKKYRLKEESEVIHQYIQIVDSKIIFGQVTVNDLNYQERLALAEKCRYTVTLLSRRIRDLRELKVGKEASLRKLLSKCAGDWRKSNHAIVISSIRTAIYQMGNCIEDLINNNENLCKAAAISAQGRCSNFQSANEVTLQNQANYICLANAADSEADTSLIKQRSEEWFRIRADCLVAGSTINKAIGLDGLKNQKSHLDIKAGRKASEDVSPELQQRFEHGTKNELNAVATMCSTFIPAFHPDTSFYEEGCYVHKDNGTPYLVVSPDGSLRKHDDQSCLVSAIEIKCPMPGKIYTTPLHYKLPHYYASQVLSEMNSLKVNSLYFVSYSELSTAFHMVQFDNGLWNEIAEEIKQLDINRTPKRVGPNFIQLKMNIKKFCESNVPLIAELKSKTAKPCCHSSDQSGRVFHTPLEYTDEELSLKDVQKCFIRASETIQTCHRLCSHKASEVLVFLLADLDRMHKPEVPHAFPIAYALKGYSMKAETMRKMIQDVLRELFIKGVYTPVVSYDGQWASLATKDNDGKPLTLLEVQKEVYNDTKRKRKCELTEVIFKSAVVKAKSFEELMEQVENTYKRETKSAIICSREGTRWFRPSEHIHHLISSNLKTNKSHDETDVDSGLENGTDYIFSTLPVEVLENLSSEEVTLIEGINNSSAPEASSDPNANVQQFNEIADTLFAEYEETGPAHIDRGEDISNTDQENMDISDDVGDNMIVNRQTNQDSSNEIPEKLLKSEEISKMLKCLQEDEKFYKKWINIDHVKFELFLKNKSAIMTHFTKEEIVKCLFLVQANLEAANLKFAKSWNKGKLADFLNTVYSGTRDELEVAMIKPPRKRTPDKLTTLCKRAVNKISKAVLNAVVAESVMPEKTKIWRDRSPFAQVTFVGNTELTWFSCPEYNPGTLSYIFSFLDVHHLITNCRIKVCKDGMPARGIKKQAWMDVAKANTTTLKIPHVEDLIDKQSDSIARQTFSKEVENAMSEKYPNEAYFCKLIREFYEGEDDPGISANDRCVRRMALRDWLLEGVNFCRFPPYGSHINDIPNVMYQGFLTNIERRMQLFPYVKCGSYNVRALGSLEAENLFGQFQDLDPKGTGVVKAEEVPAALETACQLLKVRLQPDRPFHMTLSRQKVYPVNELLAESETNYTAAYIYPSYVTEILVKDHLFDVKTRAKRKAQRKLVTVSGPDDAARGVQGVRQFHKYDESKILPHKRLGIDLSRD